MGNLQVFGLEEYYNLRKAEDRTVGKRKEQVPVKGKTKTYYAIRYKGRKEEGKVSEPHESYSSYKLDDPKAKKVADFLIEAVATEIEKMGVDKYNALSLEGKHELQAKIAQKSTDSLTVLPSAKDATKIASHLEDENVHGAAAYFFELADKAQESEQREETKEIGKKFMEGGRGAKLPDSQYLREKISDRPKEEAKPEAKSPMRAERELTPEEEHEKMRMGTMSDKALMARADKIKSEVKMRRFYEKAKAVGKDDLANFIVASANEKGWSIGKEKEAATEEKPKRTRKPKAEKPAEEKKPEPEKAEPEKAERQLRMDEKPSEEKKEAPKEEAPKAEEKKEPEKPKIPAKGEVVKPRKKETGAADPKKVEEFVAEGAQELFKGNLQRYFDTASKVTEAKNTIEKLVKDQEEIMSHIRPELKMLDNLAKDEGKFEAKFKDADWKYRFLSYTRASTKWKEVAEELAKLSEESIRKMAELKDALKQTTQQEKFERESMAKAVKIDKDVLKKKLSELVILRRKAVERMKDIMDEVDSQKNVKKAVLDKQGEWWGKARTPGAKDKLKRKRKAVGPNDPYWNQENVRQRALGRKDSAIRKADPERKQQWIQQRAGKLVNAHRRKIMPSFERATSLIPNIVAETVLGRKGLNPTDHQELISSFSKKVKGLYRDNPNARRILSGAGGRDYAYKLAEKMLSVKKSLNEGQRALTPTKEREKPLAKSVIDKQLGFVAEKLEKADMERKQTWTQQRRGKMVTAHRRKALPMRVAEEQESYGRKLNLDNDKPAKVKAKNPMGKLRSVDKPYEIWKARDFEWRVLKKYQAPEVEAKNPYAKWFCAVRSSFTKGQWEYGDTYVKDIKGQGAYKEANIDEKPLLSPSSRDEDFNGQVGKRIRNLNISGKQNYDYFKSLSKKSLNDEWWEKSRTAGAKDKKKRITHGLGDLWKIQYEPRHQFLLGALGPELRQRY